jgi:NTE family protein
MRFTTYEDWFSAAAANDARNGAHHWQRNDHSTVFDYRVIRNRLDELRDVRASGDVKRLIYYYDEGVHGNMGGMGSASLYRTAATGTKQLIADYIQELTDGLDQLAQAPHEALSDHAKYDFFTRAAQAFGKSALMLSGAGSLGPFHMGVAKALVEQNLLPEVISGASAGAIVAGMLCAHTDAELATRLDRSALENAFAELELPETGSRRRQLNIDDLRELIEFWIPDITFGEALEASGRHLNVSVAPSEVHQQSRTLNPVTARNVFLREAILASCAVPGFIPPVALAAKGPDGARHPYVKSRKWVDGSITNDLPTSRLRRIYGCNFYITSQTNPMVLWAVQDPNSLNPFAQWTKIYQSAAKQWSKAWYPFAMQSVRNVYPVNIMTRMWYSVLTQDYTADVNIIPRRRYVDPRKLLAGMPADEALSLVNEGERATWPSIERIRNSTRVGRKLSGIIREVESRWDD